MPINSRPALTTVPKTPKTFKMPGTVAFIGALGTDESGVCGCPGAPAPAEAYSVGGGYGSAYSVGGRYDEAYSVGGWYDGGSGGGGGGGTDGGITKFLAPGFVPS
ncbi:hypothetical protein KDK_45950 [Dictyobacter kobayashii]|uniref:Uncharacterized protein n=1 Tax=Dictyobacter kobayashii TaxID=2014872 RepID=A0A402AP33_9CHLR|nr:hypothetical protein KDK_45950 [Dictyobacter kobayashii]